MRHGRLIGGVVGFVVAGTLSLIAQSWSTPLVWQTGQTVTAAQLNAYISDNTSVLRAGGIAISSQAANEVIFASSSTQLTRSANLTFNGSTLSITGNVAFPTTATGLISNTSDGSDTKALGISGGGAAGSDSRGAYSFVYGNEHATEAGNAYVVAGAIAGARVRLYAVGDNVANVTETAILPGATLTYALGGASDRWSSFHSGTGNFSGAVTLGDATADVHVLNGRLNSGTGQPSFLAVNSASDTGLTGTSTVDFDTEVTDTASNFAADTFTAPVAGRYHFCAAVYTADVDGFTEIRLTTTAASFRLDTMDGSIAADSLKGCVEVTLALSDTAIIQIITSGTNVDANGGAAPYVTFFSGRLVP